MPNWSPAPFCFPTTPFSNGKQTQIFFYGGEAWGGRLRAMQHWSTGEGGGKEWAGESKPHTKNAIRYNCCDIFLYTHRWGGMLRAIDSILMAELRKFCPDSVRRFTNYRNKRTIACFVMFQLYGVIELYCPKTESHFLRHAATATSPITGVDPPVMGHCWRVDNRSD